MPIVAQHGGGIVPRVNRRRSPRQSHESLAERPSIHQRQLVAQRAVNNLRVRPTSVLFHHAAESVAMETTIKISVTTIIISRTEKPSGRCPPLALCHSVTRPVDASSITTHGQHKLDSGAATAELPLRGASPLPSVNPQAAARTLPGLDRGRRTPRGGVRRAKGRGTRGS